MRAIISVVLFSVLGCAGAPKPQTQPAYRGCNALTCGSNGGHTHGTADERAQRVESVVAPDKAPEAGDSCPPFMCGTNGTRANGTSDDAALRVDAVTLPAAGTRGQP